MTRRMAAFAVLCGVLLSGLEPATPRAAHDPAASLVGHELRGVPLGVADPLPVAALPSASAHDVSVPAFYTASATWCAPRGDQCTNWSGTAELAAVYSFRWGDEPYWVRVWRGQDHADALVVSHCACGGTDAAIDLSPYVFEQLAPLSRGRIDVLVEVLDGSPTVLPPTDSDMEDAP